MTSALLLALMIRQGVLIGATTTTMADMTTTQEPDTTAAPTTAADMGTTAAASVTTADAGTTAAASGTNADAGTTAAASAPATVSFDITIAGVDYATLSANATVMAAFESACVSNIADALTGISESDVAVTFAAGSIIVSAVITVPSGVTASSVSSDVTSATSGNLGSSLVADLAAIPGIDDFVSGTMSATISAPVVAGGTTDSSDELSNDGAWRGAGSVSCAAVMLAAVALW